MFSAEHTRPVCPLSLPVKRFHLSQPVFLGKHVSLVCRQGLNYSKASKKESDRATHIIFYRHRWKNRIIGARAARRNAGKWVNGSGKTQKRRPGMSLKMELERQRERAKGRRKSGPYGERTETDRRAGNFCYSSQRACSVETQTQSREREKRGAAGKSLRRQLFCTSITYGVCILFAALFTH
jgi:hypothetical protein